MGAKTWMLVYSNGYVARALKENPQLNTEKTIELVQKLFPNKELETIDNGDLSYTSPPSNVIYAGAFDDVFIIAVEDFAIDYPSKLPQSFFSLTHYNTIQLHAMHSVVDWFAFALWENGQLKRSLSLSPDSNVIEDIGEKLPFELPYWNGEFPVYDPEDAEDEEQYPFQFHPLDLGEETLKEFFGYVLEGRFTPELIEPENIPLMGFKKIKPWWKLW